MVTTRELLLDQESKLSGFLEPKTEVSSLPLYDQAIPREQINCLSLLLPYDPSTRTKKALEKGLYEYQMLLNALSAALQEYKKGELERFDALVGENACQIRAVKIAVIYQNKTVNHQELEPKIERALEIIEGLLEPKKIVSLMQQKVSLEEVLEKEGLLIELSDDEMFLYQSFLLTETKDSQSSEQMFSIQTNVFSKISVNQRVENNCFNNKKEKNDFNKLKKYGDIPSNFAKNFTRKLRKSLSKRSIYFVRDIAFSTQDTSLLEMVSEGFSTKHLNCSCIPMFWTYKTLFHEMHNENIPVIIHAKFLEKNDQGEYIVVDEDHLIYENVDSLENSSLNAENFAEMDFEKPAFVMQGIVYSDKATSRKNWKDQVSNHSIKNIVLAGAADHRQYPNPELDEQITQLQDKEYENYKRIAQEKGFSIDNPSSFFIQHVYASQIGKFFIN